MKLRTTVSVCALLVSVRAEESVLQQVQVVFRHGDRSAIQIIPGFENADWPQGLGELSQMGIEQQLRVGTVLREEYITKQKLIRPEYNCMEVHVRSTDVDRTLMSVQSQLAGWFPDSLPNTSLTFRPIPVHTRPVDTDWLLRPYDRGSCPLYTKLEDNHNDLPSFQAKLAEKVPSSICTEVGLPAECSNNDLLKKCQDLVIADCGKGTGAGNGTGGKGGEPAAGGGGGGGGGGGNGDGGAADHGMGGADGGCEFEFELNSVYKLADTLFCRRVHKKWLPSWASDAIIDYLYALDGWTMYQMFAGATERKLTGGNLIAQLYNNAEARLVAPETNSQDGCQKIDPQGSKPLVLYSAHDTTVSMLMQSLDPNHFGFEPQPPYASAIIFELWANPRTKQRETATVRLRFQNSTELLDPTAAIPLVPLPIPGCSSPFDCSLTEFESLYASLVPTNWDEECALQKTLEERVRELPTWKAIGGIGLFFFAIFFCYCCVRCGKIRRQQRKEEYNMDQGRFLGDEGGGGSGRGGGGGGVIGGGGDDMELPFVDEDF